jgi:xylulokinase
VLLDVARRRWSEPVLELLDIDPSILPPVLESPEPSGETDAGVPVVAGAGDQAAGAVGVGVTTAGPASVVLGTSGVVFAALDRYASDPAGRVHAFCHAIPGTWHAMGVMLSAAGALQWLHDVTDSSLSFDELTMEAVRWDPGVEGLTFLPYLAGERTPYPDPDARGAFAGLSLRHDRGALVRAVLEGVAFGLRDGLDLVLELGGAISSARVSGGGARSDLWLQILASVLELPLDRVRVDAGAAFGAALLGGVGAGIWPDVGGAVSATVSRTERIEPIPDWAQRYRELRPRYRALYPALRDLPQSA